MNRFRIGYLKENPLVALYIFVFIDLLGVGILIPLLPYYVSSVGADVKTYGLLISIYGIAQLIGGPIMGRISDTYGRRTALLISCFGTAIGYLFTGLASSLMMLVFSRIPVGLVKQTSSVSKAYISDVSNESNRAKNIGLIGTFSGVGFIIGPLLGGLISRYGQSIPAFVSSSLFAINFLFVYFFIPEPEKKSTRAPSKFEPFKGKIFARGVISQTLNTPIVGTLLISFFVFSLSLTLFRSNFAIYAKNQFNLTPRDNGFVMSYLGVLEVLTQTFAIGYLTKHYSEAELIFFGCLLARKVELKNILFFSGSLFGIAFASTTISLALALIPNVLGNSIASTCFASSLTKAVKSETVGVTLGLSDSLESLGRIISPTVGGYIMEYAGNSSPPTLGGLLLAFLSVYLWIKQKELTMKLT